MTTTKNLRWLRLLGPVGAYGFFALQFIVPIDSLYAHISAALRLIGLSLDDSFNHSVVVTVILFAPYFLICIVFQIYLERLINRLTVYNRLSVFADTVDSIGRYHRTRRIDGAIDDIMRYRRQTASANAQLVVKISIEALITDLRDGFQELMRESDIKVAIFIETQIPIPVRSTTNYLQVIATTEFDHDYSKGLRLGRIGDNLPYNGFAGHAYFYRRTYSGSCRRWYLRRNPVFYCHTPLDKKRSFLCLPVCRDDSTEIVDAVISIDSGNKRDFMMTSDMRDIIATHVKPLHETIIQYLDLMARSA